MTELSLYKFIEKNRLECEWRGEELILWVDYCCLEEFADMINYSFLSEGGVSVILQNSGIAMDIVGLCEHYGIEPTDIKSKEGEGKC